MEDKRKAGRPKRGEDKYGDIYNLANDELHALLSEIPRALRDLVLGAYREEDEKDGSVRIYRQAPNIEAIKVVLDRTMGKPTTRVETTSQISYEIDLTGVSAEEKLALLELAKEAAQEELGISTPKLLNSPDVVDAVEGEDGVFGVSN